VNIYADLYFCDVDIVLGSFCIGLDGCCLGLGLGAGVLVLVLRVDVLVSVLGHGVLVLVLTVVVLLTTLVFCYILVCCSSSHGAPPCPAIRNSGRGPPAPVPHGATAYDRD